MLCVSSSSLDVLIDKLGGPSKVAEMTGRRARIARDSAGKPQYELRQSTCVSDQSLNVREVREPVSLATQYCQIYITNFFILIRSYTSYCRMLTSKSRRQLILPVNYKVLRRSTREYSTSLAFLTDYVF